MSAVRGVWSRGNTAALDAMVARVAADDPALVSMFVLPNQSLPATQWLALCDALKSNTHLRELDASGHAIGEVGALVLGEALMDNTALQRVCVGGPALGDAGLAALAPGLALSTSLRRLDLENKGVTAAGIAALTAALGEDIAECALECLVLSRNEGLGDAGASALASAMTRGGDDGGGGLHALQQLVLRAAGMTAACALGGVAPGLAPALPLSHALLELDLRGNDLGSASSSSSSLALTSPSSSTLPPPSAHVATSPPPPTFLRLVEAVAARAPQLEKLVVADCHLTLVVVLPHDSDDEETGGGGGGTGGRGAAGRGGRGDEGGKPVGLAPRQQQRRRRLAAALRGCTGLHTLDVSGNMLCAEQPLEEEEVEVVEVEEEEAAAVQTAAASSGSLSGSWLVRRARAARCLGAAFAAAPRLARLDASGLGLGRGRAPADGDDVRAVAAVAAVAGSSDEGEGGGGGGGGATAGPAAAATNPGVAFVQGLASRAAAPCGEEEEQEQRQVEEGGASVAATSPPLHLPRGGALRHLDLSKNALGAAAAAAAVSLLQPPLLELLLTQNGLGNAGAAVLAAAIGDVAAATETATLRLLDLANNGITEPGSVRLLEAVAGSVFGLPAGTLLTAPGAGSHGTCSGGGGGSGAAAGAPVADDDVGQTGGGGGSGGSGGGSGPAALRVLVLGGNTLGNAGHAAAAALEEAVPGLEVYRGKLEEEEGAEL